MTDLLSSAVGGRVVACNDEFFAEAANLLQPGPPRHQEQAYTDRGKWMDGWETRRRREPGHDWCILALGIPGRVERVVVDTSHFTGNYPEAFSLDACGVGSDSELDQEVWEEILPQTALQGDTVAELEVSSAHRVTHLRLNIHPDGGIARLRAAGTPIPSTRQVCPEQGPVDLVSALVGGEAVDASDLHYSPPSNLLRPTEPEGMWDGWETRRRRGPGHDWASFRLGLPGSVEEIVVDTRHFKGNAPGWVSLQVSADGESWSEAVSRVPVQPDSVNTIPLGRPAFASLVRLDIHPDGGVGRFRVHGRPDAAAAVRAGLLYLNSLFDLEAARFFAAACSSRRWGDLMMEMRPFPDPEAVQGCAQEAFDHLVEEDWMEAFAGHPRIGDRGGPVSDREQASTAGAPAQVLTAMAEANRRYEERFGFTYIVYATGRSAEEMLAIAETRLVNTREVEVTNASLEQRAITATRLRRMLCLEQP